jgi:hypothetical protein
MELKQKAVYKAKMQAESMLKPLNQKLGKAMYISDVNSNIARILQGKSAGIQIRGLAVINKEEEYDPIDIAFEQIKLESSITINFGIE